MTDQELEMLMKELESDVVERKESLAGQAPDAIRQAAPSPMTFQATESRASFFWVPGTMDPVPGWLLLTDSCSRSLT